MQSDLLSVQNWPYRPTGQICVIIPDSLSFSFLLEKTPDLLALNQMFHDMLVAHFEPGPDQPLDVSLIELPTLLEADTDYFDKTRTKTTFEKMSRKIFFTYYRSFLRKELNGSQVT